MSSLRRLTRREILEGALGTTAIGLVGPGLGAACGSGRTGASGGVMADGGRVAEAGDIGPLLPDPSQIWQWVQKMAGLGPRYTGNPAHVQYVDFLASGLQGLGLTVTRDTKTFFRWDVGDHGIAVTATGAAVPVTSYYPYSGETPAAGVTAPLVYAGSTTGSLDFSNANGKIAIIDAPVSALDLGTLFTVSAAYPAGETFSPPNMNATSQLLSAPNLAGAMSAGAVGVILVWTNVSDAAASDQYLPFGGAHQGLPALWVGNTAGTLLKGMAGTAVQVTLTLEATTTASAMTDTIWALLPGQSADEVIIVNSHTDGPNAAEENGGVMILAIATALSKLPLSERKRTVVFALTTGHFAYGPGSIVAWIADHPDIIKKAVAAVTIEHCGCLEWNDDASGNYVPTGHDDWGITMTERAPEVKIYLDALQGTQNDRMFAMGKAAFYFGEGSALNQAQIPALSYIPLPTYLCSGPPNGHIDKLSSSRIAQEVLAFARAIRIIDGMTATALKG